MDIDAWYDTTYITKNDFNHIMDIVSSAGKLDKKVPYKKLVNNSYSEK